MLLTDSDIITEAQMSALDGEVPAVSGANKVDIGASIRTAWSESAQFLTARLQAYSGGYASAVSGAPFSITSYASQSIPRARLSNIVATVWDYPGSASPIESWLLYSALYCFYRDASTRKAKDDRLSAKMAQYQQEKKSAWSRIEAVGVPIVINPISAPAATHEPLTGTWDSTNVTITGAAGAPLPYDFAVTWVGSANASNSESAPSSLATIQFTPGQTVQVSIASLIPPTGNYSTAQGYASGITTGQAAVGWRLYAGPSGKPLTRQSATMSLAVQAVSLTAFLAGPPYLTAGQYPTSNFPFARQINRYS